MVFGASPPGGCVSGPSGTIAGAAVAAPSSVFLCANSEAPHGKSRKSSENAENARPVRQYKRAAGGRGGWCFEHNALFRHALEALGFSVTSLAARVLWNTPPGSPVGARSHMLLRVDLDGHSYIADVGFGGNVLTSPLRLETHVEQPTPHERHRLLPLENGFVLEAFLKGEWNAFYRFTLEPQFPADYEVSNWHLCNHPSSFFRQLLMVGRVNPEGRYALRNNVLSIHRKSGTETRNLGGAAALRHCLEADFGLKLPESPELTAGLERVCT